MPVALRQCGLLDYATAYAQMRAFTDARTAQTPDEIWLCQHPPVYTQGQAGRPGHILSVNAIPVIQTDRGGQVTYHGPGQVVAYPLIDLRRAGYFVKELVWRIEEAVLQVLASYHITGHRVAGAPGIYVRLHDPGSHATLDAPRLPQQTFAGLGKIAALGLKVHRHCSYHGVALNVQMDLSPFAAINPCGYPGLPVTQTHDLGLTLTPDTAADELTRHLFLQLQPTGDTHHG